MLTAIFAPKICLEDTGMVAINQFERPSSEYEIAAELAAQNIEVPNQVVAMPKIVLARGRYRGTSDAGTKLATIDDVLKNREIKARITISKQPKSMFTKTAGYPMMV